MFSVGEGVDGGDGGEVGEFLDVGLSEGADDCAVDHAAEDAGGVAEGFAAAELGIAWAEVEDAAAEFLDTDFEADAGAGGGFGEDHGP